MVAAVMYEPYKNAERATAPL